MIAFAHVKMTGQIFAIDFSYHLISLIESNTPKKDRLLIFYQFSQKTKKV